MRVVTKEEIDKEKGKLIRDLRRSLFVYPTDTVYGLGCNATERKLVHRLRVAKQQFTRPVSIVAPGIEWINENCETKGIEEWLEKLPGPYTLILKLKNKEAVSRNVTLGTKTIGVRLPNHWISKFIEDIGVPIITTSANIAGEEVMTSIDSLDKRIKEKLEYIIYDGQGKANPSKIVDLTKEDANIIRE